LFRSC